MGAETHFHFQVVVDGTDQDLGGAPLMKGPLGDFQLLVGPHHRPGPELFAPAGGAEHVEAVERRPSCDLFLLALAGEGAVSDPKEEVLGHLVFVRDAPHPLADGAGVCVPETPTWVLHHSSDLEELGQVAPVEEGELELTGGGNGPSAGARVPEEPLADKSHHEIPLPEGIPGDEPFEVEGAQRA